MNKPERKQYSYIGHTQPTCRCSECIKIDIHNRAIDDYENFLPSEEEIAKIIKNPPKIKMVYEGITQPLLSPLWLASKPNDIAKAISKRIRGDNENI